MKSKHNNSICNNNNYFGYVCFGYTDTKHRNYNSTATHQSSKILSEEVLFLTLSNLLFILPILLALYKRLFIESLMFFYTMLFSIFYHSCDQKYYCIFNYNELQLADFTSSYSSFMITILSMSELDRKFKAFTYFLAILLCLSANLYNRFNKIILIVLITISFIFTLITWSIIWYKKRKLFPTKIRLILYIPGLVLSITGLFIYNSFIINKNYWILHSFWHMLMAVSILFFLPDCDQRPLFEINICKEPRRRINNSTNLTENNEIMMRSLI
jgi:transmembrane protein 8A/B